MDGDTSPIPPGGPPPSQTPPKWFTSSSELPFFVVLRNSTQGTSSSSSSSSIAVPVLTTGGDYHHIYPEVRYVFEDDDFSPTMDVLEQNKNDISVIVDFNSKGDQVLEYKSLSPSWQVLNVYTQSSSAPMLAAAGEQDGPSTMLFIEGTSSEVPVVGNIPSGSAAVAGEIDYHDRESVVVADPMLDLKSLIESFKGRNEQLRQILFAKEE